MNTDFWPARPGEKGHADYADYADFHCHRIPKSIARKICVIRPDRSHLRINDVEEERSV